MDEEAEVRLALILDAAEAGDMERARALASFDDEEDDGREADDGREGAPVNPEALARITADRDARLKEHMRRAAMTKHPGDDVDDETDKEQP